MPQTFDGRYDRTKPWQVASPAEEDYAQPKWTYNGPWASNMERLTQQALMVATLPGSQIQQMVRPNIPQIRLLPDRFGYGDRTQPTIEDVVSVDRAYTEPRVSWKSGQPSDKYVTEPRVQWNSGSPAGYSGSSRNDLGSN